MTDDRHLSPGSMPPAVADEPPAQANPTLSAADVACVSGYGTRDTLLAGQVLYERGDRGFDLFLLLDGHIDVYDESAAGPAKGRHIVSYGPHQFTGELTLLNGHKSLARPVARERTRVVRLGPARLRSMLAQEPDIARTLLRAFILRRRSYVQEGLGSLTIAGDPSESGTLGVITFLRRNGYPFTLADTRHPEGRARLADHGVPPSAGLPVVSYGHGEYVERPSARGLANLLGMTDELDPEQVHDVAVVGAGPAGLAAAVYAASEGLRTVVVEADAPGGQAGTSSMIENYLGFPLGLSGQNLASRAEVQARKFGARIVLPCTVRRLDCDSRPFALLLDDGSTVRAHTVVIATGARYRRLDLDDLARFEHNGVHYAATSIEAALCAGAEAVVVGGANSAGQAAVFLSRHASHVHMLVRGDGLSATMSQYLLERIAATGHITLHTRSEVTGLEGARALEQVHWVNNDSGERTVRAVSGAFLMLGAVPNTGWLQGCVDTDAHGFVRVGLNDRDDADGSPRRGALETSVPGVFAVGDVRSGSVKRVASAVGEGSMVISAVHESLAHAVHR